MTLVNQKSINQQSIQNTVFIISRINRSFLCFVTLPQPPASNAKGATLLSNSTIKREHFNQPIGSRLRIFDRKDKFQRTPN